MGLCGISTIGWLISNGRLATRLKKLFSQDSTELPSALAMRLETLRDTETKAAYGEPDPQAKKLPDNAD